MNNAKVRHPSIMLQRRLLEVNPNLPEIPQYIAAIIGNTADAILDYIKEDNNEITEGLRELVRAKDSFIRAFLINEGVI